MLVLLFLCMNLPVQFVPSPCRRGLTLTRLTVTMEGNRSRSPPCLRGPGGLSAVAGSADEAEAVSQYVQDQLGATYSLEDYDIRVIHSLITSAILDLRRTNQVTVVRIG